MILAQDSPISPEILGFGGILFLLSLWVVVRTQRRAEKLAAPASTGAPQAGGVDPEMQNTLRELLLRIEESHRRIGAAIDTRLKLLTQLTAEADKRIELLKSASQAPPSPAARPAQDEDPEMQEIYRMAGQGLDPVEIARKTNRQRGEIDLILSLRKLKQ